MCPYEQIALHIGPGLADSLALAAVLLAYAWRVADQALGAGAKLSLFGSVSPR